MATRLPNNTSLLFFSKPHQVVTVIYGVLKCTLPVSGSAVQAIRDMVDAKFPIPKKAEAYVHGKPVRADYVAKQDDVIEFIEPALAQREIA
jgi:hypothetical protein